MTSKKKRNRRFPVIPIAQQVRLGQLGGVCYDDSFLTAPQHADTVPLGFGVLDVVIGDDLDCKNVPYGLLCRDLTDGSSVIWIRGTWTPNGKIGVTEWATNFDFWPVHNPYGPGLVSRGINNLVESFRCLNGSTLTADLVAGHSKGAGAANLLAARLGKPVVAFAAPKIGNGTFCAWARSVIPTSIQLAVKGDIVTEVPLEIHCIEWLDFEPISQLQVLDGSGIIWDCEGCRHTLTTYLHLLDQAQPLRPDCAR